MNQRLALLLLVAIPAPGWGQAGTEGPGRVALTGFGGTSLGYVVPGTSRPQDVQHLLDSLGGLGPERRNAVTFTVGGRTMRPRLLYTPPATMNQLYFDHDILVLVVEGIPRDLPGTAAEFRTRFPTAQETRRETGWYEMQTRLTDCLWLIAVFGTADDRLQSDGYAYTCTRPENGPRSAAPRDRGAIVVALPNEHLERDGSVHPLPWRWDPQLPLQPLARTRLGPHLLKSASR